MRAQKIFLSLIFLVLSACQTAHKSTPEPVEPTPVTEVTGSLEERLVSKLGMGRDSSDLGYAEKRFNSCEQGLESAGQCRNKFLTVVHFQLLCRDSEGTVQSAPVDLTPLISNRIRWKIGGIQGDTTTDGQGYGRLTVLSERSTRGQRLILRIGKQFMGFTASDLSKVVLPKNFCS